MQKLYCKSQLCTFSYLIYCCFRTGAKCVSGDKQDNHGIGQAYHEVGLFRTKPGRGIPTHSMSCSDKMMKWNIMGCQGALMTLFLSQPIYISSYVTVQCGTSVRSLKRALIERVPSKELFELLSGTSYCFYQPDIIGTNVRFECAKSNISNCIPSASSISWSDVSENCYDIIAKNGLRLGITKKHQCSVKAVSIVSRLELFKLFKQFYETLKSKNLALHNQNFSDCVTYGDFKKALPYSKVWNIIRNALFSHWVVHDESLDKFIYR